MRSASTEADDVFHRFIDAMFVITIMIYRN